MKKLILMMATMALSLTLGCAQTLVLGNTANDTIKPSVFGQRNNSTNTFVGLNANRGTNQWHIDLIPSIFVTETELGSVTNAMQTAIDGKQAAIVSANTEILFNTSGTVGGSSNLTFNNSSRRLDLGSLTNPGVSTLRMNVDKTNGAIALLSFQARDSIGTATTYGVITHEILDGTDGSEDSQFTFATRTNGGTIERARIGATNTTFNTTVIASPANLSTELATKGQLDEVATVANTAIQPDGLNSVLADYATLANLNATISGALVDYIPNISGFATNLTILHSIAEISEAGYEVVPGDYALWIGQSGSAVIPHPNDHQGRELRFMMRGVGTLTLEDAAINGNLQQWDGSYNDTLLVTTNRSVTIQSDGEKWQIVGSFIPTP